MNTNSNACKKLLIFALTVIICSASIAQAPLLISGTTICLHSQEAIPFSTIALIHAGDSTLFHGTIGDQEGDFVLSMPYPDKEANLLLMISFVGYQTKYIRLEPGDAGIRNLEKIFLEPDIHHMDEFVLVADRISARTGNNKISYFLNQKIYDASYTGMDVLKLIPGVQVDFMQNISLEGQEGIAILVNGRMRDGQYVRQLDAKQIDRIEIIRQPDSSHEANINGMINIVLKETPKGVNVFINAEVPTSASEYYIYPNFGVSYGTGRFNFHTSYDGEISKLDLTESNKRYFENGAGPVSVQSLMKLRQDHWSHRFHAGVDFLPDKNNQFYVYGFINPYSQENSGDLVFSSKENDAESKTWMASKNDADNNLLGFGSLFYKHSFRPEKEIVLDLGIYRLRSENTVIFHPEQDGEMYWNGITNAVKPRQHTTYLKIDYSTPLSDYWSVMAGAKGELRVLHDARNLDFHHREQVMASYISASYAGEKLYVSGGLRAEHARSDLSNSFQSREMLVLPFVSLEYKPVLKHHFQLSFRRSVRRPNLHQLNPAIKRDDPFSLQAGNPLLEMELRDLVALSHSIRFGNSFISSQLFYQHVSHAINYLSFVNQEGMFETQIHNLGDISRYGIQLSSTLHLHHAIIVNPSFRVFQSATRPGAVAQQAGIGPINMTSYEAGLSGIFKMNQYTTASFIFNYFSPRADMQQTSFSNALYYVSLERNLKHNFKVGITSALPFKRSFVYDGLEVNGDNLHNRYEGVVRLSAVPFWMKISYQFGSGKKLSSMKRETEHFDGKQKIGF